jgi:hypothetical protein
MPLLRGHNTDIEPVTIQWPASNQTRRSSALVYPHVVDRRTCKSVRADRKRGIIADGNAVNCCLR